MNHSSWEGDGPRLPDPRMIAGWQLSARPPAAPIDRCPPEPGSRPTRRGTGSEPVVRPFLLTGGRTHPVQDGLRIESIVMAPPAALEAPLRFELRSIVRYCQHPRSLAEVASALRVPLGVAKVLVADALTGGLLILAPPEEIPTDVIERIRDCVRAL